MSGGFNNRVVIAVGRLNPITLGHMVMIRTLREIAESHDAKPILFLTDGEKSSKDVSKNPLSAEQRLSIVRKLFPGLKVDVVASAYEALEVLDLQGLKVKAWVAGSDRASNYRKLLDYEKLDAEVVEVDREAGDADGVSATKARKAALENDMDEFARNMPTQLTTSDLADIIKMICEANNDNTGRCRRS